MSTAASPRLDPYLRLPYQTCPSSSSNETTLSKNWSSMLDPRAIYFISPMDQVIGTSKKTLTCFLSRDSIYFGKLERGKLEKTPTVCRRLLFSSIRKIVTNICRPTPSAPSAVIVPSNFFVLFLLSPQEKCDCIVVGMESKELLANLKLVWESLRLSGKIPIEERPKERSFKESAENYRVPQSSRIGEVDQTLAEIMTKDAVDAEYKSKVAAEEEAARRLQEDFPESVSGRASGGLLSPRGDKRVSFAADALASPEQTANTIAMKAASSKNLRSPASSSALSASSSPLSTSSSVPMACDPLLGIPYTSFTDAEQSSLFPNHGKPDRAILFLGRGVFFYKPAASEAGAASPSSTDSPSAASRGSFMACFVYMTRDAIYVGDSERTLARCAKLQRLTATVVIADIRDLTQVGEAASSAAAGVLLQFSHGEPDLLIAFTSADKCDELLKTLSTVMKCANPNVVSRQRTSATVREAKADLRVTASFVPDVLHVPSQQTIMKEHQKAASASASPMISSNSSPGLTFEGIPTVQSFSGAQKRNSSVTSPALMATESLVADRSKVTEDDELLRDDDDDDEAHVNPPSGVKSTRRSSSTGRGQSNSSSSPQVVTAASAKYVGLASVLENDEELYKEFYVSSDIRQQCPMIDGKKVAWAGQVVHRPAPLVKQAGQQPAALVIAFLTTTHLAIALNEETPRRVVPLKKLKIIRVQTRPRGPGEPSRQIIVLVMDDPEFDLCLEVPREEDGKVFLNQLFNVLKQADPYALPAVKPFIDIEKEEFHFDTPKFYKPETISLKENGEAKRRKIHFLAAVRAYFEKYDPAKLKNAEKIAEEHIGREKRLAEKLKKKYGHALEDVTDPQGFRTRLARFCSKYLPDSTTMIDDVLYEYQGREEQLFAALVARFGPEPAPGEAIVAATAVGSSGGEGAEGGGQPSSNERVHRRLVNIYRAYQPERLNSIKEILTKYRGREDQLFRRLVKMYGPEPPPDFTFQTSSTASSSSEPATKKKSMVKQTITFRDRVLMMARKYFPKRIDSVDAVCAGYTTVDRQQELISGLIEKYGPEPVYPSDSLKEQLRTAIAPYRQQQPFSNDELEQIILMSYNSPQATEESFLAFIEAKIYDGTLPEILPAAAMNAQAPSSPRSGPAKLSQDPQLSETLDALTELPYVDAPQQVEKLYPNLRKAAVFWFDTVQHWEPPYPAALHHAFITPSHLYISDSEQRVIRCVSLDLFRAIYINTKRDDQDSKCAVLVKLSPAEHDLFLAFASDEMAKKFVWVSLEVLLKYRFNQTTAAFTVKGFNEPGMEQVQLRRQADFVVTVAPLTKRQSSKTMKIDEAAHDDVLRRQANVRLLSAMHDSLMQQADDADTSAEWERKQAALLLRANKGLIELTQRDTKVFGTVPSSKIPGSKLNNTGANLNDDDLDETLKAYARQGQFGEARVDSQSDGPREDDPFAHRRLHLAQKLQFLRHSVDGRYGRAGDLSQWAALDESESDPLQAVFTEKETQAGRDYAVGAAPLPPRFLRGGEGVYISGEATDANELVTSSVQRDMLGSAAMYERVRRLIDSSKSSSPPSRKGASGVQQTQSLLTTTSSAPSIRTPLHTSLLTAQAPVVEAAQLRHNYPSNSSPLFSSSAVDMQAGRGELLYSSEYDERVLFPSNDPALFPQERGVASLAPGSTSDGRYELLFASHYPAPVPHLDVFPAAVAQGPAVLELRTRGLLFAASAPVDDQAGEGRQPVTQSAAQAFDIGYL